MTRTRNHTPAEAGRYQARAYALACLQRGDLVELRAHERAVFESFGRPLVGAGREFARAYALELESICYLRRAVGPAAAAARLIGGAS